MTKLPFKNKMQFQSHGAEADKILTIDFDADGICIWKDDVYFKTYFVDIPSVGTYRLYQVKADWEWKELPVGTWMYGGCCDCEIAVSRYHAGLEVPSEVEPCNELWDRANNRPHDDI